jgi:circadian clock protein KaiC
MKTRHPIPRVETGVRNLDAVFGGGLPKGSVSLIAGPPGAGKTILTQQLCFHTASPKSRILYFNTLSEPTAKTLRYMKQFEFFDARKLEREFHFVDLGVIVRSMGLEQTSSLIMERIKKLKPAIVVIDSFKTFDDLAKSKEELRKFSYEVFVKLMAWEVTALLLGEYGSHEHVTNPLFSVIDGLVTLTQRESSGEQQRFLQVVKMRGTPHSRDEHPFVITSSGIEVFAPRVTIHREPHGEERQPRCKTGIEKLDELLADGIPRGSSLLIAGVAGTGKTVMSLEFIYRGALAGEKGILFSFEETTERLLAAARGMGWDLAYEIERGMIELVFVPQPEIVVEGHLLMMRERAAALGARRIAVDSISVFLHKVKDPQIAREKVFQLASIVQNTGAVGFFATDIPYGSKQISRFGVEETVVDGVILLSSTEEGFERQRYVEVYKLRNTAHLKGRHSMVIGEGGIKVFPRYAEDVAETPPAALGLAQRLPSGIPGLDPLMGGGLLKRSATLLVGSAGIGKSTMGLQFILEGVTRKEPGLIFTLEESPEQLEATADALGMPLRKSVEKGLVEVVYLPRERVRSAQFLTVLGDTIVGLKARRVLLDGVGYMQREGAEADDLRQLLNKLVARFKGLDVTSILTAESRSLHFGDAITEGGFSPVADNLLVLRYVSIDDALAPAIRIVKTRGSEHDRATYTFHLGKGGAHIAPRPLKSAIHEAPSAKGSPPRKSSRTKGRLR